LMKQQPSCKLHSGNATEAAVTTDLQNVYEFYFRCQTCCETSEGALLFAMTLHSVHILLFAVQYTRHARKYCLCFYTLVALCYHYYSQWSLLSLPDDVFEQLHVNTTLRTSHMICLVVYVMCTLLLLEVLDCLVREQARLYYEPRWRDISMKYVRKTGYYPHMSHEIQFNFTAQKGFNKGDEWKGTSTTKTVSIPAYRSDYKEFLQDFKKMHPNLPQCIIDMITLCLIPVSNVIISMMHCGKFGCIFLKSCKNSL
jgi:glucan phosphoethanolaminetransferase (alkaline phosphatase superfamily)